MDRRIVLALVLAFACASGPRTDEAGRQEEPRVQPVVVVDAWTEGATELPPTALAPGITPEGLEDRVAQFAPVELDFDDGLLNADQRFVVRKLVEASDILGGIFRGQVWGSSPAYAKELAAATGPGLDAAREYYDIMAGPWDRLEHNEPFLGVGPKPAGAGYYPPDLTKAEIEAWLEKWPAQRDAFTSYTTVIQRGVAGRAADPAKRTPFEGPVLLAVPYSNAYHDQLERAAALLDEAAARAGNASLKDFLARRAEAFRTNDYYASEVAWMKLEGNLIEPTIGPYEVYEDELMGWKAAFESYIAIKDPEASADLETLVEHLPALEAALPIGERYKSLGRSFGSPISVVDLIYAAGDARDGVQTLAFNLPNDPRISDEHGTKKVMLRNVIEAKFEKILVPIAERVLEPSLVAGIEPRPFFISIVMHELAHGLGPRVVHGTDTPVSVALGASYSPIEEAKADVVGYLSLEELADDGVYSEEFRRQVTISAVAGLFRCVRFGTGEAHGKGCAVQLDRLLEEGAVTVTPDGRFDIEFERVRPVFADLGRDLLMLEAVGDGEAAERLLAERGDLGPAVRSALERLTDVPVDIRPHYAVLDRMRAWAETDQGSMTEADPRFLGFGGFADRRRLLRR
ncbi:MAG: dipeptidyl-peptidase 3 family protein [Gemmatimonadota bacterium]